MNSTWQSITLINLSARQWMQSSYLHHGIGILKNWRQGSWLMQWAEPLGGVLVATVLSLAPFVSNSLIGFLLIACAAYWILLTISDDAEPGSGITPIHLIVLLYWGIMVVATAISPVRAAAVEGLTKLTLYVLLFMLIARLFHNPRLRSTVITVYLLTALIVSVAGLRQWFFGADALATWVDPESSLAGTTRVYSFLGNPNLLAGYLLPAVVFSAAAFFAWKRWLPKALAVVMWLANSVCLVLTFSRGGWIGFVMACFCFLLLCVHWYSVYLPRFWRRFALPLVLGGSAALVIVAVVAVAPIRDRVMSMFSGREDSSNNFRINVWMAVVQMIRDYPLLGIGPGNDAFKQIYPRYQITGFTALSAYSIFLEVLVEAGVLGLLGFLWLLVVLFNQGWVQIQRLRRLADREGFWLMATVATMVGMLCHGLVDTVWYRPQISTLWWLMIALVTSFYRSTDLLPVAEQNQVDLS
jgi:putative inorganic carbon (hco3(-)) transporter